MKKVKELMRKIFITVLLLTMCQSSLFCLGSAIAAVVNSTATGKTEKIQWSNNKIDAFSTYIKQGNRNLNLFCIQKGAHIGSIGNTYSEYNWGYDSEVFGSEDSYKKLTWIKNNFFEMNQASDDDKYTTDQKLAIIKTVDANKDVTIEDIESVFNSKDSNGNYNEKFKLYQYLTWTYAKNQNNFDVDSEANIQKYLGGTSTSLYKVYMAIRRLAYNNYNNTTESDITITKNSDVVYDESTQKYTWELTINNSYILPYNMTVNVDGAKIGEENYSYDGNKLVISNVSGDGIHSFEVIVDTYKVSAEASIWKHYEDQNMIEIKSNKKEYDYARASSATGEVGSYSFNIKKVDANDNSKTLSNMQFKIQNQIYTTDSNGIAVVTENQDIENSGITYTYTIEEISETDSTATDKTNAQKYVKLKNPITVKLISGVTVSNNIYVNNISNAIFENGETEIEAKLINGKKVTLKLETTTGSNYCTNVTLTIPNIEKEYDLALTKTIVQNSYKEEWDYDFNGILGLDDVLIYSSFIGVYNDDNDKNGEIDGIERVKEVWANNEQEIYRNVYNQYYNKMPVEQFIYMFDYNKDGIIDSDSTAGSQKIMEAYSTNMAGVDIDRLNNIDYSKLNNNINNEFIKTATYNMNKQTYKVLKGDIIVYRINVYNEGDYDAKDIEITDYIPEGLTVCNKDGVTTLDVNNQITLEYNGGAYIWTISDNGKTAKCTISETIAAYETTKLSNNYVYIACKVTDSDTFKTGDILYNVAEITASTAVNKDGTEVGKQGEDIEDRDSKKDSIKENQDPQTLIDKYEDNFLDKNGTNSETEIDKTTYDYQDDDDFERIEISNEKIFDLALRKSISKVGTSKENMTETQGRIPEINENTVNNFNSDTTGAYKHKKEYLTVNFNDYVEYTIRVYNEGGMLDYSGYASQITDYLPEGLEFYAVVDYDGNWVLPQPNGVYKAKENEYGGYDVTYNKDNNKVIIDCVNPQILAPKDHLNLLYYYINKGNPINSYYSNSTGGIYGYQEIKLICKVLDTVEDNKLLTNIAEITESVAIINGEKVTDKNIDIDSEYANTTISEQSDFENFKASLDTYYEEKGVNDENIDYYPGLQDDDDFETVQVNVPEGNYNFEITKIDESGQIIQDETTEFKVEVYAAKTEQNGKVTFSSPVKINNSNGEISTNSLKATTGVVTDLRGIIITPQEAGKTYYFVVTETKAPDDYTAIDYKVVVPVTFSQNGATYEATKGDAFAVNISDNTKKDLDDSATTYNEATATQNGVTISVKVPNKEIPKISKSVTKVWHDNNNQDGIRPEKVEVALYANTTLYSKVELNSTNNWSHAWNELPTIKDGNTVTYTIKELEVPEGYTATLSIEGDLTTITNTHIPEEVEKEVKKVWKDENTSQTRPNEITVKLFANGTEKESVKLNQSNNWYKKWSNLPKYANGVEIKYEIKEVELEGYTTAYSEAGDITTITNTPITGNYSIRVKKVDEDIKSIENVKFSLNQAGNTNNLFTNDGKTDANGDTSTYTKNIVKDNLNTQDEYTLTELEVPDGYLKLAKPITIRVSKKLVTENNNKKYTINQLYVQADESADKSVTIDYSSTTSSTEKIENVLLNDNKTTATIDVTLNESGLITIQVTNISVKGSYNLQLYKTYITQYNEKKILTTASFRVTKDSSVYTLDTKNSGYSKVIEQSITKENVANVDKYTIKEVTTGTYGISGLKNNIIIEVTKGLNSDKTAYIIKSITAYEQGKTGTTENISVAQGGNITINNVELANGSMVNLSLTVNAITSDTPNQTILLEVVNNQIPNKYGIQIKKIDKFSEDPIEGRTFEIYKLVNGQRTSIGKKTTLSDGFATIEKDISLDSLQADKYYIRETYDQNYDNKYIKIENYEWLLTINKAKGTNNDYIVSNCDIKVEKIDGKEDNQLQKSIAEEATVEPSEDGGTVTITIPNQPDKDFEFEVNKVDSNGSEISGSTFKIVREAAGKAEAETQGDPNEGSKGVILTENVVPEETFYFRVYENEVPVGYKSLFVDGNGYVRIKVTIDSNGNIDKSETSIISWVNAIEKSEREQYIQEYLTNTGKESILEVDTNKVTINIPNPSITTDFKLSLNKHSYGNKANKVSGAEFSVRKVNIANAQDNKSVNGVISFMNNSANVDSYTRTTNNTTYLEIDSLEGIKTNNTFYYEIVETKTPTNFDNKVEGVLIKVVVDNEGNVTSSIIGIKPKNQAWFDYSDSVDFADRVSLWDESNNTYRLDFANDMVYQVRLHKKSFNGTVSQIEKDAEGNTNWTTVEGTTANFTIKKVEPLEQVIKNNETIADAVYVDSSAQAGVTYKYTFVEESSSSDHKNLFEGKTIELYVKLNKDGTVNESEDATYISIQGCSSAAHEKYLKDFLQIQIQDNTVNLYIINPKNKLNIQLMKVANTASDRLKGAKFSVIGPNQENLGEHTTDGAGYIYLNDIDILGTRQVYVFTETEAPAGVTKLENTQIILTIDTTGISSESELTADRVTVSASATGAGGLSQIDGLTAEILGNTILLTVPNKSRYTFFNIEKTDVDGNRITGTKYNEDKLTATELNVSKITNEGERVIFSQILPGGLYGEGRVVSLGNSSYEYKVQEVQSQDGYVNILEGWDVYVHVETDANGKVIDTENNGTSGSTYFYLKAQEGKTQKYTEEEIRNGNYITLDVIDVDITGVSLPEGVTESRAQKITLHIENPYEYKLQLQKTDLFGNSAVATLKAENQTKGYTRAMASDSYKLHEDLLIEQNVEQTWKITEVTAKAPYINMLDGHEVFVTVKLNSDKELVITNFNIDGDENSELKKYVVPTIEKVNDVPTLSVKVKNPLKYYVQLEKIENDSDQTPMTGANLTITNGDTNETRYITTLDSETEPFENEAYVGKGTTYTIKENSTQTGHINVLKDKTLYVRVEMDKDYKAKVRGSTLVDSHGQIITGEERNAVMKYIEFDSTYTTTGFQLLQIKVKNPVEVKFKLTKKDTSGNPLEGTQIKVTSNKSAEPYYTDGSSTIEFTEKDLAAGDIISYTIEEINTVENSAYVNVFNKMYIIARINTDGTVQQIMAYMPRISQNGGSEQVPLSELEFVESYKISDPDSTGIQTIELVLQNPTKFDFELVKKEANTGEETNGLIKDTQFRITSSFSGEHLDFTNNEGSISFTETDVKAGDYSFKIQEVKVPDENYVNILENKYIMVNVHVAADGTVTFKDESNKYTLYESSGTQITDTQTLDQYKKYIDVDIDDSSVVNKIKVLVRDPVKIGLELYKVATDGTPLGDAEFSITSSISNNTITDLTSRPSDSATDGSIVVEEPLVDPGLYTFEITENETSNDRYENVLKNCKIVVYVRVNSNGSIDLVDSAGNDFEASVKNKFYIQNLDGTAAENSLYNYVSINTDGISGRDRVYVRIENPVKFYMDIVKLDSENNEIEGALFTVYRDDKRIKLNQEVTSEIEIEENKVSEGIYEYKIAEIISPNSYKYINVLKDKFIKVSVEVLADGTVKIVNNEETAKPFEIYEGNISDANPKLIDSSDAIYSYVTIPEIVSKDGEPNVVKIEVENPTQYNFYINKRNAADKSISGSSFTAIREDENGNIEKILDNATFLFKNENPIRAGNYTYYITENKSPDSQYINILEGKYIKMYVSVSADGKVSITNSKFQPFDGYYELYKGDIETRNGEKIENSEFITVEVPNPGAATIYTVRVNVINPIGYNVDITKKDTSNNVLPGANFIAVRENVSKKESNEIFKGEVTSDIEAEETPMRAGNYIYYFTETEVPGNQYNNILKSKYVKVYVKVSGDGKVIITDSKFKESEGYYEIYKGDINNRTDSDTYISNSNEFIKVGVTTDGTIYTIGLEVINPVKYNININKKVYGKEGINLENVTMTLVSEISGTQSFITDENGNTPTYTENEIKPGVYKYLITEDEAASEEFVNILQNKGVVVFLRVKSDGSIEIVDEEYYSSENKYYICDITDPNKLKYLDNDIATNFVNVYVSKTEDGVSELNFDIKNPQKYNFSIIKKDKDTNERMNGVEFELTVKHNNQIIDLKDANTLQNINTSNLITANVNGEDGVINVNNILFEECGTYVFQLHEKEIGPNIFEWLYQTHKEDIVITIEVTEEDGQYVISKEKITQGMEYLDSVEFTDGLSAITTEVTNERIKGKYDLVIDKLDSYTETPLDGAVFNIEVKDESGQNHNLYKATDNVNSKDVILPKTFTVTNGKLEIEDIRIDRPETYIITLTETVAPKGYMLLDEPIQIKVTTGREGEYDDEKFVLENVTLIDGENYELVSLNSDENTINLQIKNEYFDLALRKSITSVAYPDSEDAKITEDETKDRIPNVVTTDLDAGNNDTTAIYNHEKDPVRVYKGQEVIYTFRVYNEGEIDGYAEEITDHLPDGLEFLSQDEFNTSRGWIYDSNDSTLRTVKTRNLSKQYGEEHNQDNLIKARNKVTGELDYKEIQIKCIISDEAKVKTILTNIAEISEFKSIRTSETVDRDSEGANAEIPEPGEAMSEYKNSELNKDYVPGQEDDDDFEKLIVEEFDLSLRKYITAINGEDMLAKEQSDDDSDNTQDETDGDTADEITYEREPVINVNPLKEESTTAEYTHPKDPVEVSIDDIVRYTISVYNEGTVSGYASLIKDDIPEGLQYVKDSEINKEFNWKLLDKNNEETDDVTKAKYIVTDYLAKENGEDNIINAFDGEKLDTKFVQVEFKVIVKQDYPKIIVNQAQISDDTDESGKGVKDRDSVPDEWNDGEDDQDEEFIKVTYLDLSLRKFITKVNDQNITNRIPEVDATALVNETGTTAKYTHTKDPVLVHTTDKVTYTIRVYNEGSKDGYATVVKDDIPDGLEFIVDDETNKKYEWKLLDEDGKEVTDASKAKYVVTDYLSKDNETNERQNLMKAFDKETMELPEFKEVKVTFKVVEPTTSDRIVINQAQIAEQTDGKGIHREDRDSVPDEWKGEDDEDIEKIKVQYFDLALRKWVTKAIVVQNGQTKVTETGHKAEDDPEEVVKVDLKKSKIDSVVVKFEYQIRITNEGEVAGYAKEITDYIPEGLKFDAADNTNWVQVEDDVITTDQLKDTLLQPGESAEVTVVLTWINSKANMGVKVNIAEISKDYNEYNTPDIDSTPNNRVYGEDDIDDAPVMLTIKTGANDIRYILIALGVLIILGLGVSLIKEKVKRDKS